MKITNLAKVIFTVAGISLFLALPATSSAINLREELLFSSVQIISINESGDSTTGSGSTISKDGLILTNNHVVIDKENDEPYSSISICYTISQYEPPRCAASAKVLATNKEFDLALIAPDKKIDQSGRPTKTSFKTYWKRSGNEFYAVPFKNTKNSPLPNILDPVTIWGYPGVGGTTITVSKGYVSGFGIEKNLVKFIKTDASVNPGNSGGSAFDEWFAFIGIPSNAWPGQLGFLIPTQTITEWLENLDSNGIIDLKKIDSITSDSKPFTDIDKNDPLSNVTDLLRHLKIIKGYPDSTFKPDQPLSYGEASSIITAAKRLNKPVNIITKNPPFITEKEFFDLLSRHFGIYTSQHSDKNHITRRDAANAIFDLITP